jgi:hypothetical protein
MAWRPDFAETSTPDWIVHLQAHADGFDGVVTSDWHQLEQNEEVVALDHTRLSVITWGKGMVDPVQQWGSLLVYMPQIRRRIAQEGPSLIRLPIPHLSHASAEPTAGISHRYANEKLDIPRPTLLKEVVPEMIEELEERGLQDLIPMLRRRPRRTSTKPRTGT